MESNQEKCFNKGKETVDYISVYNMYRCCMHYPIMQYLHNFRHHVNSYALFQLCSKGLFGFFKAPWF